MASIQHQPFPAQVVYDWSSFDQGQKKWPIPKATLLIAVFFIGVAAPLLLGRFGIVAAFFAAACYPSKSIRRNLQKGDIISILATVSCVMMLGNFDAIGDLLGSHEFRFSWFLLALSAPVIAARLKFCLLYTSPSPRD